MQYTLRNIPKSVDRLLREKARVDGKSLNEAALDALTRGLGLTDEQPLHDDLDWFLGGQSLEAKSLKAIEEHDAVHTDDWK